VPFPPVTVNATLGGTRLVPAVTTVSTATVSLVVDGMQTSIDYSVTYACARVITAVEIRLREAGTNGPMIFTLATAPFTNPLTGTLNSLNLTAQPSLGVVTISDAIDRILNGNAYVLISIVGNPTGEIRGADSSVRANPGSRIPKCGRGRGAHREPGVPPQRRASG
jgi:hypothetical protein